MRDRLPETPSIEAWLSSTLSRGDVVGLDPFLFPIGTVRRFRGAFDKAGVVLAADVHDNAVDAVWRDEQPPAPCAPLVVHPLRYAGMSVGDKLARLRTAMAAADAAALVLVACDEVMWTFNIRGGDVDCNPIALSYGVITASEAVLYIDERKVTPEAEAHLRDNNVRVAPYSSIVVDVRALPGRVWLDPANASHALLDAAGGSSRVIERMSPVQLLKAVKNDAELEGMRAAHLRDATVLTTFLAWLEAAVTRGVDLRHPGGPPIDFALTEFSVGAVLDGMRAKADGFVSLSFPTIAAWGPNGANCHYRAHADTALPIGREGVFLLDSGGQYVDGTTDVTRTVAFGTPTAFQREAYTAVLQGHIALSCARFPPGTSGVALDSFARAPLWARGLDYRHGTGHGVGAFLNVHEGPHGAASVQRTTYDGGVLAGMTLTDEPGYYHDGEFGIRIENVLVARVEPSVPHAFGGRPYLGFEPITWVPISASLVDVSQLTAAERIWLNAYNAGVRERLEPRMISEGSPAWAREYLVRETAPV